MVEVQPHVTGSVRDAFKSLAGARGASYAKVDQPGPHGPADIDAVIEAVRGMMMSGRGGGGPGGRRAPLPPQRPVVVVQKPPAAW